MSTQDDLRKSADQIGLSLTDDQLAKLAKGESVELDPATAMKRGPVAGFKAGAADPCDCGEGFISIGHKPKWCIKPWPFTVKVLPGC
jgi:hypothetical protein